MQAPNLEQLEVLESTSKSLLPALIQKDGGKDCLDRMVSRKAIGMPWCLLLSQQDDSIFVVNFVCRQVHGFV